MNKPISGYDIIGDIHGHAEELKTILKKMNYQLDNEVWAHPERKAIFVGDYIDRGPEIREALSIVKGMTDEGSALAIMGNHEFNAIAFNYHRPDGGHIRKHSVKNMMQHYETIKQFKDHEKEWEDYLAWFANLPLFLEVDGIRIVHACWDDKNIEVLKKQEGELTKEILLSAHQKGTEIWQAYEETLKGKEMKLPHGHYFIDKDGNKRTHCRNKWWLNSEGLSLEQFLFHAPITVSDLLVSSEEYADGYDLKANPVFFGHYWLDGKNTEPIIQATNICCLDYSVAKEGKLVVYRHNFNEPLSNKNFVTFDSIK